MNTLALDISTKRTGYAFRDRDGNIQYGAIAASDPKVEKRIIKIRDAIIKLAQENEIENIVAEEVRPDGLNNHTGKVLTWIQGCIAIGLVEWCKGVNIEFIGPSSWRKVLGIRQGRGVKRDEQKQLDISYAASATGFQFKKTQDDEADAICILLAYEKENQSAW